MKINKAAFQKLIDDHFVSVQKHPTHNLWIYNYTQKCQFDHMWTPETRMARGLIVNDQDEIVARPFDKFFNMEEHDPEEIPQNKKFAAYDKADGSLGIMYSIDSSLALATRGSFMSDQAVVGTDMLRRVLGTIDKSGIFKPQEMTYLFEIIYPENRIVIDYKGERKLVFLGARSIETGEIFTPDWFPDIRQYFESVQTIEDFKKPRENAEGVVLYYENGFMCKVKYEEYVRLHRLVTGVTARSIWDLMRHGESTKELVARVPEEFKQWVDTTQQELHIIWAGEMILAEEVTEKARELPTRKHQADFILRGQIKANSKICFCLLDGKQKEAEQVAWTMIKPKAERPFREDM